MNAHAARTPWFAALLVLLVFMALSSLLAQPTAVGAQGTPTPSKPSPTPCLAMPGFGEGFESGTLGRFSSVVATCVPGGCGWTPNSSNTHSGSFSAFSPDLNNVTDQQLVLTAAFAIPASGATGAELSFWHRYTFEGTGSSSFDGGVLEVSTNGGASWSDTCSLMLSGFCNGTISSSFNNPLAGRAGWVQVSPGFPTFYKSTVNLISFAGKNVLFRFRQGDDSSVGSLGWWIDDVQVAINACFHQDLPIIRAKESGNQDAQYDNSLLGWLQSLWNAVAGWLQPPPRTSVTQ
jgi:hypothetical protein